MQNFMLMFTFFVFDWKHIFWLNLVSNLYTKYVYKKYSNLGQATIGLMIKLRSRLLRLATVARKMITGQKILTLSRVISGPTRV